MARRLRRWPPRWALASAANIAGHIASNDWRVGRFTRPARLSLCFGLALAIASPQAASAAAPLTASAPSVQGQSLDDFYAARGYRPLWFGSYGDPEAAFLLIDLLRNARVDGLDPNQYASRNLDRAIRAARSGNPNDVYRADRLLTQAFYTYARDLKHMPKIDMIWVDRQLLPSVPSPRHLLESAAAAPSIEQYLADMPWMSPIYAGLRQALASGVGNNQMERDLLRLNLERARALPAATGKYVIVNATAARLSMYEDGQPVDSMRVVVGKPVHSTPMMAALIRYTSLNPYWNVPADLAAERIAPNVVKDGPAFLKAKGYQLLSGWDNEAKVISPATTDWAGVAAGHVQVRLRQLPGPSNAMGSMKFMFPNAQGIYLHDTPEKQLLGEEARMFSGGCVRLEDAPRLAKWLYGGHVPTTKSALPEQRVDLPEPVPVFLTYLTAMPTGGEVAFLPDVYNRDQAALALLDNGRTLASR